MKLLSKFVSSIKIVCVFTIKICLVHMCKKLKFVKFYCEGIFFSKLKLSENEKKVLLQYCTGRRNTSKPLSWNKFSLVVFSNILISGEENLVVYRDNLSADQFSFSPDLDAWSYPEVFWENRFRSLSETNVIYLTKHRTKLVQESLSFHLVSLLL